MWSEILFCLCLHPSKASHSRSHELPAPCDGWQVPKRPGSCLLPYLSHLLLFVKHSKPLSSWGACTSCFFSPEGNPAHRCLMSFAPLLRSQCRCHPTPSSPELSSTLSPHLFSSEHVSPSNLTLLIYYFTVYYLSVFCGLQRSYLSC